MFVGYIKAVSFIIRKTAILKLASLKLSMTAELIRINKAVQTTNISGIVSSTLEQRRTAAWLVEELQIVSDSLKKYHAIYTVCVGSRDISMNNESLRTLRVILRSFRKF